MRACAPLVAAGCAAVLAGCGGTSSPSSSSPTATAPASSSTTTRAPHHRHPARRSPIPRSAARIGRPQRVHAGDSTLQVTVTHVDGALRDSGAALLPGDRAAGVHLTIRNLAGGTYDSTASGDVGLILSTGAAAPLLIRHGSCLTQLTDFESLIGAGETRSGCVGFAVARHAHILGVRFSPHSRPPGTVYWR